MAVGPNLNHATGGAKPAIASLQNLCQSNVVGHLNCEVRIGLGADIVLFEPPKQTKISTVKSSLNGLLFLAIK